MQAYYNGDQTSADALNKSSKRWSIASIVVNVMIIVGIYVLIGIGRVVPAIVASVVNNNSTMID